jgi:ribulose-phosphate 3-epimerase
MAPLKAQIGPSILNANLSSIVIQSQKLLDLCADYLNLDVIDANFVPNLTFDPPLVESLRKHMPNAF